ncbi:uncharacterized protein LOC110829565 isoform X3 [Zootermopsis nevadensis]|uniref:uncharacterized protein LOC110829565 isoform X3 n=1 Tax=Zootermopsis nevadensis TaxID=136037 RepID=UPI000B8ECB26|nr:uncharacterized protein LOC110829565 isoform X3 [Zootermopsis nevadensis]
MRTSFLCVLCIATHLAASLPLEPSAALQDQQPQEEQETLVTLDLGNPRHDTSARDKRTIGFLRQLFPTLSKSEVNPETENQVTGAESQLNEVRVQYADPMQPAEQVYNDQEDAASGGNGNPADVADEGTEEDQRNKRFLNFGFGADSSSSSSSSSDSGSGGGSGNFLFDIIRQTANRVARTAGTVYRVVAGTESLDLGLGLGVSTRKSTTRTSTNQTTTMTTNKGNGTTRALVAGSGNTDSSNDGKPAEVSAGGGGQVEKDDGYQAGIPGPITRLFIIANRGIANLVQDLILRLAQTSERIVNFKARLITAII